MVPGILNINPLFSMTVHFSKVAGVAGSSVFSFYLFKLLQNQRTKSNPYHINFS